MPIRILLLTPFLIVCLFAQTPTATVVGRVIDSTGAGVPEAKLRIRDVNTNAIRTAESGGDGAFAIPQLAPRAYELVAEKSGFRRLVEPGIMLQVEQVLRLELN